MSVKAIEETQRAQTSYRLPLSMQRVLETAIASVPVELHFNMWGNESLHSNSYDGLGPLTIDVHHPGVLRELILSRDPFVIIDAYVAGLLDYDGALEDMTTATYAIPAMKIGAAETARIWLEAWTMPRMPTQASHTGTLEADVEQAHSLQRDKQAIQAHYDLGNEFYKLWLDPRLVYSCAHFERENMSLTQAQEAKLDLICKKLRLQPGETFMDIGCGWGGLLRWAAENYGVHAYGITLSEKQLLFNQQWIAEAGLQDRVQVELRDYRQLPPGRLFDKIVSVGMIEHVGIKNYPMYFKSIYAALKPDGLFLNHGITTATRYDHKGLAERFINRYVFPNGELASITNTITPACTAGWEVVDVDCWRTHYARTLQCWYENFKKIEKQAIRYVTPEKLRIWKLYLNGSAIGFRHNYLSIYQTLLRRAADRQWNLPLNRSGWLS